MLHQDVGGAMWSKGFACCFFWLHALGALKTVPPTAPLTSPALCSPAHSVHLRVLDGSSYGPEQQELALESLLEFTREPALMTDVYINYDCDVQCTNLFETICHSLSSHALPRDGMVSRLLHSSDETRPFAARRGRADGLLRVRKVSGFFYDIALSTAGGGRWRTTCGPRLW